MPNLVPLASLLLLAGVSLSAGCTSGGCAQASDCASCLQLTGCNWVTSSQSSQCAVDCGSFPTMCFGPGKVWTPKGWVDTLAPTCPKVGTACASDQDCGPGAACLARIADGCSALRQCQPIHPEVSGMFAELCGCDGTVIPVHTTLPTGWAPARVTGKRPPGC